LRRVHPGFKGEKDVRTRSILASALETPSRKVFCLADEKPNPDKLDPQVLPKLFELWRRGMLSNTNNSPFDSTA
jgi:hypothetical protein